jgi:putative photosynthetic complex assembly protein
MMGAPSHAPEAAPTFPRPVLFGAGALMLLTIGLAAWGRLAHSSDIPVSRPVLVRDLRFADLPDGDVRVTDADSGAVVRVIHGQAGFLRGTMRGLATARREAGQGPAQPFVLTLWQDGRLTLDDPVTRRHVELEAFGETNAGSFAALLPPTKEAGSGP